MCRELLIGIIPGCIRHVSASRNRLHMPCNTSARSLALDGGCKLVEVWWVFRPHTSLSPTSFVWGSPYSGPVSSAWPRTFVSHLFFMIIIIMTWCYSNKITHSCMNLNYDINYTVLLWKLKINLSCLLIKIFGSNLCQLSLGSQLMCTELPSHQCSYRRDWGHPLNICRIKYSNIGSMLNNCML